MHRISCILNVCRPPLWSSARIASHSCVAVASGAATEFPFFKGGGALGSNGGAGSTRPGRTREQVLVSRLCSPSLHFTCLVRKKIPKGEGRAQAIRRSPSPLVEQMTARLGRIQDRACRGSLQPKRRKWLITNWRLICRPHLSFIGRHGIPRCICSLLESLGVFVSHVSQGALTNERPYRE